MSYYAIFKAPKEKVETLKYNSKNESLLNENIHKTKMELLVVCMKDNSEIDSHQLYNQIVFYLDSLKFLVEKQTKNATYNQYINDENGEFWFCGWEYAGTYTGIELDKAKEYALESLLILSKIVKTPDYFEESEKFTEKVKEINSEIDFFIDTVSRKTDFQIMEEFSEYRIGENLDIDKIEGKTKDNN